MKKKTTISGALPKPAKNTTGATNRTSGYLNPNAAGNKKPAPKTTVTKSGMKISITGTTSGGDTNRGKSFKPGSMVTSSKNVTVKPAVAKKKSPSLAAKAAGAVGKVAGRAKTVAREVRDIPTAVGTAVRATAGRNPGFRKDFAVDQLKKQVKEVKTAAKSGKKGDRSVRYSNVNPNKNR